jgi:hypothetical protein
MKKELTWTMWRWPCRAGSWRSWRVWCTWSRTCAPKWFSPPKEHLPVSPTHTRAIPLHHHPDRPWTMRCLFPPEEMTVLMEWWYVGCLSSPDNN